MNDDALTVLIVDDEPIARAGLKTLLRQLGGIKILGEAADGVEAVQQIRALRPGLVFLDVQMPTLDGFGVLAELEADERPIIVFVTAYDEFALKAFDFNAVDYLLKPFDRDRLGEAVSRARRYHEPRSRASVEARLTGLLEQLSSDRGPGNPYLSDRLLVKDRGRVHFIKRREIIWIEVRGNYLRLHLADESYLYRETLAGMEALLDPFRFLRISRSHLVNVEYITELNSLPNGRYRVQLAENTVLESSRRYSSRLQEFLGLT